MSISSAFPYLARIVLVSGFLAMSQLGCGRTDRAAPADSSKAAPVSDASGSPKRTLAVAAASDLRFALDSIVGAFTQTTPDFAVNVTYGSSGSFFAQISNGAPFDLFLSADMDYPRQLITAGLARADSTFYYGIGYLVVWVPKDSPLDVEKRGIEVLLDPSVTTIAISNPQFAPYGRAAKAALESLGLYDKVKDRLVLGDNVAQTAQFVESGAAEVGIVALSLAMAPALANKGRYWRVPDNSFPRLEQGGVVLAAAKDAEAAMALRQFIIGDQGRAILKRFGFQPPDQ